MQSLREVDKDRAGIALVFEQDSAEENLVDHQRVRQIKLYPRIVLEHFEADGVLPSDGLFLRINPDIEVVKKQIVVGAIRPVGATQDVCMRWLDVAARPLRCGRLPGSWVGRGWRGSL